jgi:hypothetical protein
MPPARPLKAAVRREQRPEDVEAEAAVEAVEDAIEHPETEQTTTEVPRT